MNSTYKYCPQCGRAKGTCGPLCTWELQISNVIHDNIANIAAMRREVEQKARRKTASATKARKVSVTFHPYGFVKRTGSFIPVRGHPTIVAMDYGSTYEEVLEIGRVVVFPAGVWEQTGATYQLGTDTGIIAPGTLLAHFPFLLNKSKGDHYVRVIRTEEEKEDD